VAVAAVQCVIAGPSVRHITSDTANECVIAVVTVENEPMGRAKRLTINEQSVVAVATIERERAAEALVYDRWLSVEDVGIATPAYTIECQRVVPAGAIDNRTSAGNR